MTADYNFNSDVLALIYKRNPYFKVLYTKRPKNPKEQEDISDSINRILCDILKDLAFDLSSPYGTTEIVVTIETYKNK